MKTAERLPRLTATALLAATLMSGTALAETLRVEGITIEGPGVVRVEVPEIIATDSSMDEATIRALFGTDFAMALGNLAGLDAAEIRIPVVSVNGLSSTPDDDDAGDAVEIEVTGFTYRDIVFSDIAGGVARGGASVGAMDLNGSELESFVFGPLSVDYLDLGAMFGLYGFGASREAASTELRRIYSNFRLEGISLAGDDFRCDVGPSTADEFRGRPLQYSFAEVMEAAQQLEDAQKTSANPPSTAIHTLVSYYVDFLTAFESTPVKVDGMTCSGDADDGRGFDFELKSATMGGFAPALYPEIVLDDMSVVADDGWMRLGNFTWKPIDLSGPIAAIRGAPAPLDAAWFENNWRKLIPAIEGFSLSGFDMDIPADGSEDERILASVGSLDLTLGAWVNGIPSDIATAGENIAISVPEDEEGAFLSAMGLETLSLGYDLAVRWNEAESTIDLVQVALAGEGLGAVALSGTIANAGPDLFADDHAAVQAAALGLTVRDLQFKIENAGMVPALLAAAAADEGVPPATFAAQLIAVATALPIGILGATEEALGLSQALSAFMTGTPNLTITLTSVDPAGVPWATFVAAQENPEVLKDQFTINAVAEGEAVPFVFPEIAAPSPPEVREALPADQADETTGGEEPSDKQTAKN